MVLGHVKWFDNRKGFGFVRTDGIDEDIFIHYSNIEQDGFKCLQDGEPVEFELENGNKGYHALNVRRILEQRRDTLPQHDENVVPQLS